MAPPLRHGFIGENRMRLIVVNTSIFKGNMILTWLRLSIDKRVDNTAQRRAVNMKRQVLQHAGSIALLMRQGKYSTADCKFN